MQSRCFGCRSCRGSAGLCKKRSFSQPGLKEHPTRFFKSFSASVCVRRGVPVPRCRPRAANLGPP